MRANASTLSHAELDDLGLLDAGDPEELALSMAALGAVLPNLSVLGGCCGTDHRHIARIAETWLARSSAPYPRRVRERRQIPQPATGRVRRRRAGDELHLGAERQPRQPDPATSAGGNLSSARPLPFRSVSRTAVGRSNVDGPEHVRFAVQIEITTW